MRIVVIGTGYVEDKDAGFADSTATCVDIDHRRIDRLRGGEIPMHEPRLPELVRQNLAAGRLSFSTSTTEAVPDAQVAFIAVGTPPKPDGSANVQHVLDVAHDVGRSIRGFTVVVTKSTVPVGTTDKVREAVALATTSRFAVASNPEFLKEGDAVADFFEPARVVIGADNPEAVEVLRELYRGVGGASDRLIVMDVRSAELAKYAANAMLATRISFMNEIARFADAVGADVEHVRVAIGADPRIGDKFLFAGCGFGGS